MPYRRLPNTDKSRLRALRKAIEIANAEFSTSPVVSYPTIVDAKRFLGVFEHQLSMYQQTLENQVTANKHYQTVLGNARMYISHFIQVFNMCVIRGEIKADHKESYHLAIDTNTVPDLSSEAAIEMWGKNIIDGENTRTRQGGVPVYNPNIAKVQVHYEIFKQYKDTQKIHQNTTMRNWNELVKLREEADKIILNIWNQVEDAFKDEIPYFKVKKCKEFGVVYYYRRNEKRLTPPIEK